MFCKCILIPELCAEIRLVACDAVGGGGGGGHVLRAKQHGQATTVGKHKGEVKSLYAKKNKK